VTGTRDILEPLRVVAVALIDLGSALVPVARVASVWLGAVVVRL
jgi:hypothetical protein